MDQVQCMNCREKIDILKIKKGAKAECDCGCIQKCIDADEYISRWRVINPFEFEDQRNL